MTRKQIERKLLALKTDIAGESTAADFAAMCERFDELHAMLANLDETTQWTQADTTKANGYES